MKFSYSFSLASPKKQIQEEPLHEYSYNEFLLDLPLHWKQIPISDDGRLNFQSDSVGAAIILSVDFYEIPDSKAQSLAEECIRSRIRAHESTTKGQVNILHQSIKNHSNGVGIEMSYGAEVENEHVYIYLGYVTSRKILNFTMVCRPDKYAAADLFNKTVKHFRPKLP